MYFVIQCIYIYISVAHKPLDITILHWYKYKHVLNQHIPTIIIPMLIHI